MSKDDEIRRFAEAQHWTFPVGKEDGIAKELGVRGMPATVFIARDGRIARRHMGAISSEELASGIEALLK